LARLAADVSVLEREMVALLKGTVAEPFLARLEEQKAEFRSAHVAGDAEAMERARQRMAEIGEQLEPILAGDADVGKGIGKVESPVSGAAVGYHRRIEVRAEIIEGADTIWTSLSPASYDRERIGRNESFRVIRGPRLAIAEGKEVELALPGGSGA